MVEGGRNFEALESVDVATEIKDVALSEGMTVFGEEGELGFGILSPVTQERFYYMEGKLFAEDEMPEDGVVLADIADIRRAVLDKIRPNESSDLAA